MLALLSVVSYLDRVCIAVAGPRMQDDLVQQPNLSALSLDGGSRNAGAVYGFMNMADNAASAISSIVSATSSATRSVTTRRSFRWWPCCASAPGCGPLSNPSGSCSKTTPRSLPQPSACDATSYAGYGWRGSSASPYGQMNANRCGATGSGGVMTFAPGE